MRRTIDIQTGLDDSLKHLFVHADAAPPPNTWSDAPPPNTGIFCADAAPPPMVPPNTWSFARLAPLDRRSPSSVEEPLSSRVMERTTKFLTHQAGALSDSMN